MQQAIAYLRVSTDEQGKSGLGLEAQRAYLEQWAAREGVSITDWREEVASGGLGLDDRPMLREALAACRKAKAVLVVSKLDRLSRNASFILNLMEIGAKFIVAELGANVDTLTLHVHAIVAERERKLIGERTKAALSRLKAQGQPLGSHHASFNPDSLIKGRATRAAQANAYAESLRWLFVDFIERGESIAKMAAALNQRGVRTSAGGEGGWTHKQVGRCLDRLGYAGYTTRKVSCASKASKGH